MAKNESYSVDNATMARLPQRKGQHKTTTTTTTTTTAMRRTKSELIQKKLIRRRYSMNKTIPWSLSYQRATVQ